MSSHIPKSVRVWGKRPTKFNDVRSDVVFLSRLVSVIIGPCRLVGSHASGYPAPNSDIDISVDNIEDMMKFKKTVNRIGDLFGVKIDLCLVKGGFDVV